MPTVAFANKQTMVALYGSPMEYETDPYPVGSANYAMVSLNIHTMFISSGTKQLDWQIQGSNDGENFADISNFDDAQSDVGLSSKGGDVLYSFIRVQFTWTATGSSGEWGAVCFDCHVNLKHK